MLIGALLYIHRFRRGEVLPLILSSCCSFELYRAGHRDIDGVIDYFVYPFSRQAACVLALPCKSAAIREGKLIIKSLALLCFYLGKICRGIVASECKQVTAPDQTVIVEFFTSTSYGSFPISSAYLFTHMGCRGLVEGLYLFTLYALPLTALSTAFGSD